MFFRAGALRLYTNNTAAGELPPTVWTGQSAFHTHPNDL